MVNLDCDEGPLQSLVEVGELGLDGSSYHQTNAFEREIQEPKDILLVRGGLHSCSAVLIAVCMCHREIGAVETWRASRGVVES